MSVVVFLVLFLPLWALAQHDPQLHQRDQPPNILLVLTDDQDVVLGGLEPMVSVNLSVLL